MQNYVITDKSEVERRRKAAAKRCAREAAIERQILRQEAAGQLSGTGGTPSNSFVWVVYESSAILFDTMEKSSHVTMLIYLSTFCSYDGGVLWGGLPASRHDLPTILGVSEREAQRFWSAVSEIGACREEDRVLRIDSRFFRRGKVRSSEIKAMAGRNTYLTRMYIDAVRSLYKSAKPRSLKTLAYIFQVMPFVNREYNVVCHNPLETVLDLVVPMTLGELCDTLGYYGANSARMIDGLLQAKFFLPGANKEEGAVRYVISDRLRDRRGYTLFINPKVYYAGSNWDEVKILGQF